MAKNKYLTLRDDEITSGQIVKRFDWLQQTLHTRMSKTLELVTQEEEALLTAQRVVRSVREGLAPSDAASAKVDNLSHALEHRAENKQYMRDLAPLIQDVADALPKESFSEAVTTLKALTDAKEFSKNQVDDAVKTEAARAVDERFGGMRHRDRSSDTKVLTQEGFDEMMVRLALQDSKQNTRSMGAVVDEKVVQAAAADPLFSAMRNMTNLKSAPEVLPIPETALPEAGTVEPHRGQKVVVGNVTIHRGDYGRKV